MKAITDLLVLVVMLAVYSNALEQDKCVLSQDAPKKVINFNAQLFYLTLPFQVEIWFSDVSDI